MESKTERLYKENEIGRRSKQRETARWKIEQRETRRVKYEDKTEKRRGR